MVGRTNANSNLVKFASGTTNNAGTYDIGFDWKILVVYRSSNSKFDGVVFIKNVMCMSGAYNVYPTYRSTTLGEGIGINSSAILKFYDTYFELLSSGTFNYYAYG